MSDLSVVLHVYLDFLLLRSIKTENTSIKKLISVYDVRCMVTREYRTKLKTELL